MRPFWESPGKPAPEGRRAFGPAAWTVLALAAAARAAFHAALPVSLDGAGRYMIPARHFLEGRLSSPETLHDLPGAPLFQALVFLVLGVRPEAVAVVQRFLGLAALALLMDAAARSWGRRAAAVAGALAALQLVLPYQEAFLLAESPGQFLLAAALWSAVRLHGERPGAPWAWALGGAAAGAAGLTRGEFLALGPFLAVCLSLGGGRRGPRRGGALFLGAWLVLVGGWVLRNGAVFGYWGLNPHAPTVLLDTVLPLVRHDLPSFPRAKEVLREAQASCRLVGCDPRPVALESLRLEAGGSLLEAQLALGAVAREAAATRPAAYLYGAAKNFLGYLRPIPWVRESLVQPVSAVRDSRSRGGWRTAFWAGVEALEPAGWLPLALAWLSPLALFWRGAPGRWAAAAALGALLLPAAAASGFRTVGRTQAGFYLPAALLGAFVVEAARERLRRRGRSRPRSAPSGTGTRPSRRGAPPGGSAGPPRPR